MLDCLQTAPHPHEQEGLGGPSSVMERFEQVPLHLPHKWDAKRQILNSVHESNHFLRDADLMYADDTPSSILFLVNRRALEVPITTRGHTAQENEPLSASRA